MNFRLFEEADIDLYLNWVNQKAIWEVDNAGPFEVRIAESFAAQWKKVVAWKRSWFIMVDDREIGYIGFVSDVGDNLTEEFFIVIGETTEWGKGHGKKAMAWIFGQAKDQGLLRVTGQVLGNNERALRFYKSLGFVVSGEQDPTFQRNGEWFKTITIERVL